MSAGLLYGILVVAGIGMLVGLSRQKAGVAWGRPLAIVCIIVALIVAVVKIIQTTKGGGANTQSIVKTELAFQKVSAQKLGTYLAQKYPNSKAVIIVQPKMPSAAQGGTSAKPSPLVEGLKAGFGSKITVVAEASPKIPEQAIKSFAGTNPEGGSGSGSGSGTPAEMMPPIEYWYTAKLLDQLLDQYKGQYNMIVSTIGLPQDAKNLSIWRQNPRPKVALASGSVYELKGAIKGGYIVAAVTYNPKAKYTDKGIPSDLDKAFDKRFLLLTPDTIDQTATKYPNIFAK